MGNLNSFLQPNETNLHSSGILQNQSQVTGSTSRETYTDRQRINRQRSAVGAYKFAGLHQLHRESPRAALYERSSNYRADEDDTIARRLAPGPGNPMVRPAASAIRSTIKFQEPKSRNHNPYA